MSLVLLFTFVVMPLLELAAFVLIGQAIGFLNAIGILLLISIGGVLIVRHQGIGIYRRVRLQLREGVVPAAELVDGLLILIAGLLLIIPGFITDAIGLALLLPPVRGFVRSLLQRRFSVRVASRVVKVANTQGPRIRNGTSRGGSDVIDVLPPSPRPLPPADPSN